MASYWPAGVYKGSQCCQSFVLKQKPLSWTIEARQPTVGQGSNPWGACLAGRLRARTSGHLSGSRKDLLAEITDHVILASNEEPF